jgi:hypothetical protein
MALAYLTHLPVKFLRKVAGFYGTHGDYFLGRAQLNPPQSLLVQVWPWIEGWRERFSARAQRKTWAEGGLDDDDTAAEGFLNLLAHLRVVLLQDLAILQPSKCSVLVFTYCALIDLPAQQNTLTCRCSPSLSFPTPTGSPSPAPSGQEKHAATYRTMSCCVGPCQSSALCSRL